MTAKDGRESGLEYVIFAIRTCQLSCMCMNVLQIELKQKCFKDFSIRRSNE